jgi:multidrug efflux pump
LFIVPAAYSFFVGKASMDAMKSTDASKMA